MHRANSLFQVLDLILTSKVVLASIPTCVVPAKTLRIWKISYCGNWFETSRNYFYLVIRNLVDLSCQGGNFFSCDGFGEQRWWCICFSTAASCSVVYLPTSTVHFISCWFGAERCGTDWEMDSKRGSYFPRPFDRRKYSGKQLWYLKKKYPLYIDKPTIF